MCGIFGFLLKKNWSKTDSDAFMAYGMNAIARRGPDQKRVWHEMCYGHVVGLGHSRLAIIDLSAGASQPMKEEITGWRICFNGEIYNYRELRAKLIDLGWLFHSESDTEVLLKAWAQWGLDALSQLNGMFAFSVFNDQTGELWLVRDRFGVKPLLWGYLPDGSVVFSSSAAAVAKLTESGLEIEYCARGARYKAFELPNSGSPFMQVRSVNGGGWLRFQLFDADIQISEGEWYNLEHAVENKLASMISSTDDQLLGECRYLLADAVSLRLRSDVPLAVSLSGGLDSSSVAGLAAKSVSGLKGFTYGSPTASCSEGPVAAAFAKQVGIKAKFIWPNLDVAGLDALLERTLAFQEAPFSGLSVLAQNEVFRTVRNAGFKVLLGGQGGDEIFAGYRKFFVVALRDALYRRLPFGALHFVCSLGQMLLHEAGQARIYWQNLNRYETHHSFEFKLLDWQSPRINLWGKSKGSLRSRQIEDVQYWSLPTLLRYEDRNSMGHGLETRLPFMDYRLVELALALPAHLKIAKGFGKWALRHVVNGNVPDFIRLNRKKRGFDVTQSWIESGIGACLRARIYENRGVLAPHLKPRLNIERHLSDQQMVNDSNLLNEALMLAWLVQPVRSATVSQDAAREAV